MEKEMKSAVFTNTSKKGLKYLTIYLTEDDITSSVKDKYGRRKFLIFTRYSRVTGEKYYVITPSKPRSEKQAEKPAQDAKNNNNLPL